VHLLDGDLGEPLTINLDVGKQTEDSAEPVPVAA
jgi:hypothetical protein